MKLKRILCLFMVAALLLPIHTRAASGQVTALANSFTDVPFSNGYKGFCLDASMSGAKVNDAFTPAGSTSAATSNVDNTDVSQKLKILLTHCFEDIFVSDGNGGYVLSSAKLSAIQRLIYYYTDPNMYSYIWGDSSTLNNKINAYTGAAIPDAGYKKTLANGDVITFYFMVLQPDNVDVQDFFAYYISVTPAGSHTHDPGTEWKTDEDEHWHECECGEESDRGEHTGGKANCENPAVCEICNKPYGDVDEENHTGETEVRGYVEATTEAPGYTGDTHCKDCGELLETGEEIPQLHAHKPGTEWKTDEDEHWHECECGEESDRSEHTGGEADCVNPAVCEICNKSYGGVDEDNHTGETELRGYVEATTEAPGYTGDTHCKDCGALLEAGEEIPQLHTHKPGTEWETDEDEHWHECECGEQSDRSEHTGGEADCMKPAECEACGKSYGSTDPDNHTKENTTLVNAKDATCGEDGYTGDTVCECGETIETGETIPATGNHTDKADDGDHDCDECEAKNVSGHTGGTATCVDKAECSDCGQPYGAKNPDRHTGNNTTGVNAKTETCGSVGYTGDTVCECGEVVVTGEVIPATGDHTDEEDDGDHTCDVCNTENVFDHTGGEADCKNPAECEECGEPYGEVNEDNHTGETELRGYVEATTEAPGYTGDIHCKDCGALLEEGEGIPKLHTHNPSDLWKTDEDEHWHECKCGEKFDLGYHTGGEADCMKPAECEACGKSYGSTDPDNHTKENTTLVNAKDATCGEDGYTGDTVCECGETIETGETIPATGNHTDKADDGDHDCDECEAKNVSGHTGGTATCVDKAECSDCGQPYGAKNPDRHTGNNTTGVNAKTETCGSVGYTGDTVCECGEVVVTGEVIPATGDHTDEEDDGDHTCDVCNTENVFDHTGGEADCKNPAECEECGEPYGDVDEDNHTGETELRGYVEATTEAPGYTGDTHCKDCGALLETGEEIPQLHTHKPGTEWETDEDEHWHECECGEESDRSEHTGGEADCVNPAVCEICNEPYGSVDEDNHTGETEVRGYVEATTEAPGYTGDTHCKDCGTLLEAGEEIPQLHTHKPGTMWETNETQHWHACACGEKFDLGEHTGGEADCENPAACETCGRSYGDVDEETHTGETEIRGYVEATEDAPGYTGDTYCKGCGELLEAGEETPKVHTHRYGTIWETNETQHWHECVCGDKQELANHTYRNGTCTICGVKDGNYNPDTPKTGDESYSSMWLLLCLVSFGALCGLSKPILEDMQATIPKSISVRSLRNRKWMR